MGISLVAVALGVRITLDPYLGNRFPYSLFILITAITAWVAGWRNAAVAHLAGMMAADWFFVGPRYELGEMSTANAWGTVFYLAIGMVICFFTARWQASARAALHELAERERAEKSLLTAQEQLLAHAEELESRVKERTHELREALDRLQTFTYSMVHDMRAPLRAISGFVAVLEQDFSPQPGAREYLSRMRTAAQRLDSLITDLQSYSDTATRTAPLESLDLEGLVEDLLENYPGLRAAREHIHVKRPLPGICANAALLTQTLAHLLANALKFTSPTRAPEVEVSAEPHNNAVRIWVCDNGIGIAPEYHVKIFGLFQQLHAPGAYGGTGIGLAIAKRAVERMRGSIGVESTPGEGSRFWIELPAATSDESCQVSASAPQPVTV